MDPLSKQFSGRFEANAAADQPRELFFLTAEKGDDPRLVNFHQTEQNSELTWRWSESVSMVRIRISPAPVRVTIDTGCLRKAEVDFPFAIYWNDFQVPRKAISIRQGVISFDIDTCFCEAIGEQKLTISCKPLNAENGRRKLGMPICSIRVVEAENGFPRIPLVRYRPTSIWRNPLQLLRRKLTPTIPIWRVRSPESNVLSRSKAIKNLRTSAEQNCERVVVASQDKDRAAEIDKTLERVFADGDWQQLALVQTVDRIDGDGDRNPIRSRVFHRLHDHRSMTRQQVYSQVIRWFGESPPKQAYVVPTFASDYEIALALKDVFKTRVCLHVVEDRSLFGSSQFGDLNPELVQEAIDKCDLLLVASPEMRQAYGKQFGKIAYLLPPTVPHSLIDLPSTIPAPASIPFVQTTDSFWSRLKRWVPQPARKPLPTEPSPKEPSPKEPSPKEPSQRGILIGEISDRRSLERIRSTIRASGIQVDWFLENPVSNPVENLELMQGLVSKTDLEADGIHVREVVWNQGIISDLRKRPFAILPSGRLDGRDSEEGLARLSMPSCLPFVVATAQLPIIALGNPQTCVARFLTRFELGLVADYDGKELQKAVLEISRPERQAMLRQNASKVAEKFLNDGIQEWLWQSLEQGKPVDNRFEEMSPIGTGELDCYFDPPTPEEIHWAFRETWRVINRIKQSDFLPDIVIDVGASTGVWSWTASKVFPDSRFILIDPLLQRYDENSRRFFHSAIRNCETLDVALTDHCGETEMLVSEDLYTSSLFPIGLSADEVESVKVNLLTLDELVKQRNIEGRTLLKIDVQFAEHLVINGGRHFIRDHVDYIILELTLNPSIPQARSYGQMLELMDQIGFEVIDEMEGWRDPKTGLLEQKDTVFVRREKHPMPMLHPKSFRRAA